MKKKHLLLVLTGILVFLLTGCGGDSADKYVGAEITDIKKQDATALTFLLEEGMEESNDLYALSFPEELKEPYLGFMQTCLDNVIFEIDGAKKLDKEHFSVQITFSPLDVQNTTLDICNKYSPSISSTDLTSEVSKLLEKASRAVSESPIYLSETYYTMVVEKNGDSYIIPEEEMQEFLSQTLYGYMAPYNSICEILDIQDFMTAYLDAIFKGDVVQYAKHIDENEEELLQEINEAMLTAPEDLDSAYTERYQNALRTICANCQYTVGVPEKQEGLFNYIVDITITPNTSFQTAMNELYAGTYYSEAAVNRAFIETMEKYAASPTYGTEVTLPLSVNYNTLKSAGEDGAEFTNLLDTILPTK